MERQNHTLHSSPIRMPRTISPIRGSLFFVRLRTLDAFINIERQDPVSMLTGSNVRYSANRSPREDHQQVRNEHLTVVQEPRSSLNDVVVLEW